MAYSLGPVACCSIVKERAGDRGLLSAAPVEPARDVPLGNYSQRGRAGQGAPEKKIAIVFRLLLSTTRRRFGESSTNGGHFPRSEGGAAIVVLPGDCKLQDVHCKLQIEAPRAETLLHLSVLNPRLHSRERCDSG